MKKALDKWKWSTKLIINWQRTAQSTAIHTYGNCRRTATPPKAPTRSTLRRQRATSQALLREPNSHTLSRKSCRTTYIHFSLFLSLPLRFYPLSNQITWSHSHFAVAFAFAVVALKYLWRDRSLGHDKIAERGARVCPTSTWSTACQSPAAAPFGAGVKAQVQSSHLPSIRTSV